jgi:hypothetical protein
MSKPQGLWPLPQQVPLAHWPVAQHTAPQGLVPLPQQVPPAH